MEMTWTIPVAIILAGATYAIFARYFTHKERSMARQDGTFESTGGRR